MRRPLFVIFLCYAGGICLEFLWMHRFRGVILLYILFLIIIMILCPFPTLFSLRPVPVSRRRSSGPGTSVVSLFSLFPDRSPVRRKYVCFTLALFLGALAFYAAESRECPLPDGDVYTARGPVLELAERDDSVRFLMKDRLSGQRILVTIYYNEDPAHAGSRVFFTADSGKADPVLFGSDLASGDPRDLCGRFVVVSGTVSAPSPARNPGAFDYGLYLKGKQVRRIMTAEADGDGLTAGPVARPLRHFASCLRGDLRRSLAAFLDRDSLGLLEGMLFGDKSLLGDEGYELFRKNGLGHLLAVSGLHIGFLYACILRLFRGRQGPAFCVAALAALLFYALLASFSPSVVRAVTMISVHLFSRLKLKAYDFPCCCSLSALILLILDPYELFQTGFQLSFLAVFTLAFLMPPASQLLKRLADKGPKEKFIASVFQGVAPFLMIQLTMIPAGLYLFNYVSFSSFILNPICLFLASLLLPLGFLLLLFSALIPGLMPLPAAGARLLSGAMFSLNRAFFRPGVSYLQLPSPPLWLTALWILLLFAFSSEGFWDALRERRSHPARPLLYPLATVFLSLLLLPGLFLQDFRDAALVFVDVGQGDCLHIRTPSGKNVLIDGGGSRTFDVGKNTLLPYLLKNGVRQVDLALVTHLHADHYDGIASLCRLYPVGQLGVFEGYRTEETEILAKTGLSADRLIYLSQGQRILLDRDVSIEVIGPVTKDDMFANKSLSEKGPMKPREGTAGMDAGHASEAASSSYDPEDENAMSLLLRIDYKGLRVLMTADMDAEGEASVLSFYGDDACAVLHSHVLKVAHHGSRYSTGDDFLAAVDPKMAVIQAGKNNYGHPHPDTVEKLAENGIMIYDTLHSGAVLLYEKRGVFTPKTMIEVPHAP